MAKLVKTYESGEIKTELFFKGETFILTMPRWENGVRTSNEKALDAQIREKFADDEEIESICDIAYDLDFADEDEIEEALEELEQYEY